MLKDHTENAIQTSILNGICGRENQIKQPLKVITQDVMLHQLKNENAI